MKSFITDGGKQIDICIDPKTMHKKIQFYPGGELPIELTGLYTTEREAGKAIKTYLDKPRRKSNGKDTDRKTD